LLNQTLNLMVHVLSIHKTNYLRYRLSKCFFVLLFHSFQSDWQFPSKRFTIQIRITAFVCCFFSFHFGLFKINAQCRHIGPKLIYVTKNNLICPYLLVWLLVNHVLPPAQPFPNQEPIHSILLRLAFPYVHSLMWHV
jgi:hypothetical protein